MSLENRTSTRRDLLKALFQEAAAVVSQAAAAYGAPAAEALKARAKIKKTKPFVRPPGALAEELFLDACTRCDDCVKACPEWVIRKAGPEFGKRQEGTPLLLPSENPCVFCTGLPCIAACTTGALLPLAPNAFLRIGLAVVDEKACYMGQGQPCDYCVKACPTRPKAISLGARGAPAVVDSSACTGCGECAQICPANAITIEALR